MKIAFALLSLAVLGSVLSDFVLDHSLDDHWRNFKKVFQKNYPSEEESARRLIWQNNVADIIKHNLEYDLGQHSFSKGLNEYADMNHHEFLEVMNGYRGSSRSKSSSSFIPSCKTVLPDSVDWRKHGLVTRIKNQGKCGSCWAFSTTGALEGQQKKKTGKLVSLSEQNLVDCSVPEGNLGCDGGLMDLAFEYIQNNGGIDTEKSYHYRAENGTCHYKPYYSGAIVTGYVDIPSGDESALQKAVATIGPVSVAIDASQVSFHLYKNGVYNEPNCSSVDLDHGVLAVGYGTEHGQDYWLVKNSWGTSWGKHGYIKMSRNKNNQCGIATEASYPLV